MYTDYLPRKYGNNDYALVFHKNNTLHVWFGAKPSQEALTHLKSMGFGFNHIDKVWSLEKTSKCEIDGFLPVNPLAKEVRKLFTSCPFDDAIQSFVDHVAFWAARNTNGFRARGNDWAWFAKRLVEYGARRLINQPLRDFVNTVIEIYDNNQQKLDDEGVHMIFIWGHLLFE